MCEWVCKYCSELERHSISIAILTLRKPSGLVYDVRMMSHMALDKEDQDHPECPDRLRRIYEALRDAGYLYQFKRIGARVATSEEVLFFHGSEYHRLMQTTECMPGCDICVCEIYPRHCLLLAPHSTLASSTGRSCQTLQ